MSLVYYFLVPHYYHTGEGCPPGLLYLYNSRLTLLMTLCTAPIGVELKKASDLFRRFIDIPYTGMEMMMMMMMIACNDVDEDEEEDDDDDDEYDDDGDGRML